MKQKSILFTCITIALIGFCMPLAAIAAFESGSTGADGAFEPTTNTALQIPESGIFNFTTVNIPAGVTVTFKKNAQNTPVTILASGDVTIAGTLSVNGGNGNFVNRGSGGPGAFDGGVGGSAYQAGGRGEGPGGGNGAGARTDNNYGGGGGGGGAFRDNGGNGWGFYTNAPGGSGGTTYGNETLLPAIGGSGGGGGGGTTAYTGGAGGGGGGAIIIASSGAITVSGNLTAKGGNGANGENVYNTCCSPCVPCAYNGGGGGGGSGGGIRLIANTIAGNGTISASGGSGGFGINSSSNYAAGPGGSGRIRFESPNVTRTVTTTPPWTVGNAYAVFPQNIPTLFIASAAGVDAPAIPKGSFVSPDVLLPYNTQNPITVVITGQNIPAGQTVTLKASPTIGNTTTASGALTGSDASSSVSIQINISKAYPSVLTASVTLQVASLGIGPIYAQGELVEKIRVEAGMGGGSTMIYITASGKEIPAKQLKS